MSDTGCVEQNEKALTCMHVLAWSAIQKLNNCWCNITLIALTFYSCQNWIFEFVKFYCKMCSIVLFAQWIMVHAQEA